MANMVVRTNIFALNAHRNMKNVGAEQQRASNRLASGFRINSAADDAAGLAISETMRAQIRGLDQASRNAQDGQALINTAEGGMQEIQNMLQRIRELTVQAANDTNTPENREQISLEVRNLLDEIDAMADRVEFNGMQLLTGNFAHSAAGVAMGVSISKLQQQIIAAAVPGVGDANVTWHAHGNIAYQDLITAAGLEPLRAAGNITLDPAITAALLKTVGINITAAQVTKLAAGGTAPTTTAEAQEMIDALRAALPAFGGDLTFQVGANSTQTMQVTIADMRLRPGGTIPPGGTTTLGGAMSPFMQVWEADILTGGNIGSQLIDKVEDGLQFVSMARADLGAVSNRLDFTSRSLDISSENLSDAESRVRNTDMAREMMRFTMSNVLQQAAVSMLAQANQLPNNLLQLLR